MSATTSSPVACDGRSASSGEIEFATFHVGRLLLGIDIRQTEEINRQLDLTAVPHAPACVRGVVNLRGEVVTVLDLRIILGLEPQPMNAASRNVVVRSDTEQVGLLVDRVADVVTVSAEEMELPPANVNGVSGRFFKGVYKLDSALLVVLDVNTVLTTAGKDEAN
jgi:purine-binding chemotaxis protein CheW